MGVLDWYVTIPALLSGLFSHPLPTALVIVLVILVARYAQQTLTETKSKK